MLELAAVAAVLRPQDFGSEAFTTAITLRPCVWFFVKINVKLWDMNPFP